LFCLPVIHYSVQVVQT